MGLFQGELDTHHCRKCEHWGDDVANGDHAVRVRWRHADDRDAAAGSHLRYASAKEKSPKFTCGD